jgi:hypothetical protein
MSVVDEIERVTKHDMTPFSQCGNRSDPSQDTYYGLTSDILDTSRLCFSKPLN